MITATKEELKQLGFKTQGNLLVFKNELDEFLRTEHTQEPVEIVINKDNEISLYSDEGGDSFYFPTDTNYTLGKIKSLIMFVK